MSKKTLVVSLGGSILVSEKVDSKFLTKFKKIIFRFLQKYNFIIIVGGGKLARNYQQLVTKASKSDRDWLGIKATWLNAELVRVFFEVKHPIITNPTTRLPRSAICIAAGWKPGWSTDYDAVCLAAKNKIKTVANLSNINYVYSKDPRQYKDAKKIEKISWRAFRKLIGNTWQPGANLPFDPIAAKLASDRGIRVVVLNGRNLPNFSQFLQGKNFKGTVIDKN